MAAKVYCFLLCSIAFFLTTDAGVWDSFELALSYAEDAGMCYNPTYGIDMVMNMEYQVPGFCGTMICHDSYIISTRKLEVDKLYQPIGRCGTIRCDKNTTMTVEECPVKKTSDPYCKLGKEDLKKLYPKCCAELECS